MSEYGQLPPTVGRILHATIDRKTHAAIVTESVSDELVNVAYFTVGADNPVRSAGLTRIGSCADPVPTGWHWPEISAL